MAGGLLAAGVLACGNAAQAEEEPLGRLVSLGQTSNFFRKVGGEIGSNFEMIFAPDKRTFSYGSGVFVPPFSYVGRNERLKSPVAATFQCLGSRPPWYPDDPFFPSDPCGKENRDFGTYSLANDIHFNFVNGVTLTWKKDTLFDYNFYNNDVLFTLKPGQTNVAIVEGLPESPFSTQDEVFNFGDSRGRFRGFFGTKVEVIPTPAPILGVGVALRFSRRLRKRIKAASRR